MSSVACLFYMFLSCDLFIILYLACVFLMSTFFDTHCVLYAACIISIDPSELSVLAQPYDAYLAYKNTDGPQKLHLIHASHVVHHILTTCIKYECMILLLKVMFHMIRLVVDHMGNTYTVRNVFDKYLECLTHECYIYYLCYHMLLYDLLPTMLCSSGDVLHMHICVSGSYIDHIPNLISQILGREPQNHSLVISDGNVNHILGKIEAPNALKIISNLLLKMKVKVKIQMLLLQQNISHSDGMLITIQSPKNLKLILNQQFTSNNHNKSNK